MRHGCDDDKASMGNHVSSTRDDEYYWKFRNWAEQHIRPSVIARDRAHSFDRALWNRLAETGFFRLLAPVARGGQGATLKEYVSAFSGLARGAGDIPFVLSAGVQNLALSVVLRFGSPEQQERHLEALLSGEKIAALCNSEADAGTDLKALRSSFKCGADGMGQLTLRKSAANNLSVAGLVLASAWRVSEGSKPSLEMFLLEIDSTTRQPALDCGGFWTGAAGSLEIIDAPCSLRENRLACDGTGLDVLKMCFGIERFLIPVLISATLEGVLEEALAVSQRRQSFGKPLASFQYVQEKIVKLYAVTQTVNALVASLLAKQDGYSEDNAALSLLKLVAVEDGFEAATQFYELCGTSGYLSSHPAQKLVRDLLALKTLGGTREQHKLTIFTEILKGYENVKKSTQAA